MMCQLTWRIWCFLGGFIFHSSGFAWSDYQSSPFGSNGSNFSEWQGNHPSVSAGNCCKCVSHTRSWRWTYCNYFWKAMSFCCYVYTQSKEFFVGILGGKRLLAYSWINVKLLGLLIEWQDMAEAPTSGLLCTPPNFQVHFNAGNLNGNGNLERVIKTRGWALDGSELTTNTAAYTL